MTTSIEEFIEHHGVKGMRWGVRRTRGKSVKPAASESKKVSELKKRKPSQLTNKQLKTVNERMNLEQSFSRLNPSTIQKGKIAAGSIIATLTLASTAYNLVNSPAGKAAIEAGKKAMKSKV